MASPAQHRTSLLRGVAGGVKSYLLAALNAFGFDIVRYWPDPFERKRARVLFSESIDAVLDVGANTGQYGQLLRRQGYRRRLISFEPLGEAFEALSAQAGSDLRWECYRLGLGEEVGLKELRVSQNLVSSSFLSVNESLSSSDPRLSHLKSETVNVTTLDDLRSTVFTDCDRLFLKLDVQGFELSVLGGARETLQHVLAVECELSLAAIYDNQARLADVVSLLADAGLHLCAIQPAYVDRRTGDWLQIDGLFVRDRS